MREIKAIVQPFLLSRVVEALKDIEGLPGITVSTCVASAAHVPLGLRT